MSDTNGDKPTEWRLPELVRPISQLANSVITLNQPLRYTRAVDRLWDNGDFFVAADGGANRLYEAGGAVGNNGFNNLNTIIGDLDSLRPEVRDYFTTGLCHAEIIHDPDQYSTDFGKAVNYIRSNPKAPKDTVVLGGIGGRLDQGLSQLHHLYLFQKEPGYSQGRLYLVSEESVTILLKTGTHHIIVRDYGEEWFGKHVGILPLQGPSRITTKGLEWDVTDWETEFGGQVSTSNHVLPETNVVEVHTTRDVLFTIALKNHM